MPKLIQNTLVPLWELKKVMGIDNVTKDDLRVAPGFVRVCDNIDIDDQSMIERRDGIIEKVLTGVAHSGWSDGKTFLLMVMDDDLIQVTTNWQKITLVAGVGPSRMHYSQVGSMVFFSNLRFAGYIEDGVAYPFPDDVRPNRQPMGGGSLIEFHAARLYVAQNGYIYRTVAATPFETDLEKEFIYMGGEVTMLVGVNGPGGAHGIYTSAAGKSYYLSDLEKDLENITWKTVVDAEALPGSAVAVEEFDLGKGNGMVGRCCCWGTHKGFYMGMPGGKIKDLTSEHYRVEGIVDGVATVRDYKGYRQYIYTGIAEIGSGEADMAFEEMVPILQLTGG